MTDLQPSSGGGRPADLDRLRLWLEARYAEILREIRSYPAPIPACDQHYNHLLARRRGFALVLQRLDRAHSADADPAAALDGLIGLLRAAVSLSDVEALALADLFRPRRRRHENPRRSAALACFCRRGRASLPRRPRARRREEGGER